MTRAAPPLRTPHEEFLRLFRALPQEHGAYRLLRDFAELGFCALVQRSGPPPDPAHEDRYRRVVARYERTPEAVRETFPQLLAVLAVGLVSGSGDVLGRAAGRLETLNAGAGQFFTPPEVARLLAELTLQDAASRFHAQGYLRLCEPASGAGGMALAAADVLTAQGIDLGHVWVEATDIAEECFHMTYVQLALRGVPATVRHGDSLSGEVWAVAQTPAFWTFALRHPEAFARPAPTTPGQLTLFR